MIGPGDAVGVVADHGREVPLVEGLVTGAVGVDVLGPHEPSCMSSWWLCVGDCRASGLSLGWPAGCRNVGTKYGPVRGTDPGASDLAPSGGRARMDPSHP